MLSASRTAASTTPSARSITRSAADVASKKARSELRQAGDAAASTKTGAERDEELLEYYRRKKEEKLEQARLQKQKLLLEQPGRSLIDAACSGRVGDIEYLLQHNVDVDAFENDRTALQAACQYGCFTSVEALLKGGAQPDLPTADGVTPLMLAVLHGHTQIVTYLLEHAGADSNALDTSGHSVLQCAYEVGHTAIASKILKAMTIPRPKVTTIEKERAIMLEEKERKRVKQEEEEKKLMVEKLQKEVRELERKK